jgi:hypothetical protein
MSGVFPRIDVKVILCRCKKAVITNMKIAVVLLFVLSAYVIASRVRSRSHGSARSHSQKGDYYSIGVVGYSGNKDYNHDKALTFIQKSFNILEVFQRDKRIELVSGWTNLGIPKQAYEEAAKRRWRTVGIACEKAYEYERFPVDRVEVVGKEWGEESSTFLNSIDVLLRIGGGKQSQAETEEAIKRGIQVFEYDC